MKPAIIIAIVLIIALGFLIAQNSMVKKNTILGTRELILNEQDLQDLGMKKNEDCRTEEQTSYSSNLVQYSFCNYTIKAHNSEVILELKKFTNLEDLKNTYQYDSSHLYSAEGLISENTYGDLSRFRVNNENDYGGQFNKPGVYYYHLWICRDLYLIHITSKGIEEDKEYIESIGQRILLKFG